MNPEEPSPLCGPVPDGLMRVTFDVPHRMFEDLEQASRRLGLPLDRLIVAALCFAATAP
jgi:hypothetical protein